jgi:hypothetical protein
MKAKRKVGRPRKEPTKVLSYRVPVWRWMQLDKKIKRLIKNEGDE